jgi:asparagine synthase (glutamine-hydrolysing)
MTALAGLWRLDGRPDAADGCARMLAAQALYGPHATAHWSGGDIALGRRLMRILPEDAFDRQPLVGGGGRFVLVADARLDNRDELTEALGIPSTNARVLCDAAILLAALERWEDAGIDHLVGDFAFALWDGARHRLLLARDPLGQRPLHYHRGGSFFALASMPKGLHALAEIPYAPDEERAAEFLVLMPESGPRSFFAGIERVQPGHVVAVTACSLTVQRYWHPSHHRVVLPGPAEYGEALRHQLDQAVRCRLRGAQDVGASLSGGFDSAAVTATAARLLAPSGRRVIAFTAVPREGYQGPHPRDRIVDEWPCAAAVASLYGNIEHLAIRSSGRSPLDDLDRNFLLYDQPMLNICNVGWVHSINDAARDRKLTVLLQGFMGNQGLSYSGIELLPELFTRGQWIQCWRAARALVARRHLRWRGVLAQTLGPWCPTKLWIWLNEHIAGNDYDVHNYAAINPVRLAELDLPARARARGLDLAYRPWKDGRSVRLWVLNRVDPGNFNKGVLGGWQIDQRDPTADVRLLEFCLAVPMEQFLRDGRLRALAQSALIDRVPDQILGERRKGLQGADWHEHLTAARGEISAELKRLESSPPAARALDLPRLRKLVENWPSGGWERDGVMSPYRLALLRGVSTGHFLRRATGGNP